jgi:hypothetical protein
MHAESLITFETRFPIDPDSNDFPFRRELSLAPLIASWERTAAEGGVRGDLARRVLDEVRGVPELSAGIDPGALARHRELVEVLLSAVLPTGSQEQDMAAAFLPFDWQSFYTTAPFRRFLLDDSGVLHGRLNVDAHTFSHARVIKAYEVILRRWHGIEPRLDYPLILTVPDPDTRLERHFRLQFDVRFMEVQPVGSRPELSAAARARLAAGQSDLDVLAELLPPDRFAFRGFALLRAMDMTDPEILSSLKRDLIEKESIVSPERFRRLQESLQALFRQPDLRLGVAALHGEQVFLLNYGARMENQCIFADTVHKRQEDFRGSVYERAVTQGHPLIVDDLASYPGRSAVEDKVLAAGTHSLIVAPLHYQDRVIGTLEVSSPQPGAFDPRNAIKLREVLPLFAMAVRRGLEDLETRVQGVIKEQCTAIHPSVEWRFRQAVLDSIERRMRGEAVEIEPIVFQGVYPLYGASDIRGSSIERNVAIQGDLGTHLRLAREVVAAARRVRPLPALEELAFRLDRQAGQIETNLASGDEVTVIAFLHQHLEPLLDHLAGFGPAVAERAGEYRAALDPRHGTVYRQRKAYEESVTLINDTISTYLDEEQALAQAMCPHYFEKQRTDGVDYSIYVGASLVEGGACDALYVRNLRLWQLLVTCGIARRASALRGRLSLPLDTTHLILAHHSPLAIRFRFDEKRFDVDGAYNVRYEVVKKRIDKAVVRNTAERLTQPGQIAIVYSQPAEAAEYRQYFEYLRATGHLTGPVEELELEELQGVFGLRALRVAVDLTAPPAPPRGAARQAAEGVRVLAG